ncbi:hypothetical protein [Malacoplasma penetrans]|uniref:Uncharacterized protein n=1 Tax=Malacoplasma penetrans (strain HF-2) TaxID=272633 RepID=Q8EVC5_MALP2|nr:hypothetical protein [Malacoplasma penetrans]BAC44431.1 hypothetical protein [Malacoplasma penetrans HF-2]
MNDKFNNNQKINSDSGSFTGPLKEKDFVRKIKGCKIVNVRDFEESFNVYENESENEITETTYIKGYVEMVVSRKYQKPIILGPTDGRGGGTICGGDAHDEINKKLDYLIDEMKEMKQDIKILKEDVAVLKEDVAVLKEDVAVLKEDVTILKEKVSVLEADMADVKAGKYCKSHNSPDFV